MEGTPKRPSMTTRLPCAHEPVKDAFAPLRGGSHWSPSLTGSPLRAGPRYTRKDHYALSGGGHRNEDGSRNRTGTGRGRDRLLSNIRAE